MRANTSAWPLALAATFTMASVPLQQLRSNFRSCSRFPAPASIHLHVQVAQTAGLRCGQCLQGRDHQLNAAGSPGIALRQCPTPGMQPAVAFLHVPKTAGSFLTHLMHDAMPDVGPQRWCRRIRQQNWRGGPEYMNSKSSGMPNDVYVRLISNLSSEFPFQCAGFGTHLDFSLFDAPGSLNLDFNTTLTLTMLRHPAKRVISWYFLPTFHAILR